MRRGEVEGERIKMYSSRSKITTAPICKQKTSSSRRRTPGFLRHLPVDALEQVAELRGRIVTVPSAIDGYRNRPRSSLLANRPPLAIVP